MFWNISVASAGPDVESSQKSSLNRHTEIPCGDFENSALRLVNVTHMCKFGENSQKATSAPG